MLILWFILAALAIFHVTTRYSRKGRLLSNIPGPTAYPIIGNSLLLASSNHSELWRKIQENLCDYSPISRYWLLDKVIVNLYHPDDIQILLSNTKATEKGLFYKYLECWLKTGLLTSAGDKWHRRRKILTPAFHCGVTKKYMEIVVEQAESMIESLKSEGSETVKELTTYFSDYTLSIICESAMGVALDKMDPRELRQYKKAVHDMADILIYRILRPYLFDFIFPYVPKMGALQAKALKVLHEFSNKVIHERREHHRNEGVEFLNDYNKSSADDFIIDDFEMGPRKKRLAMLDLLLAAEKKGLIDNAGIQEEVDTFIFAGHDITSVALKFTVLLLAEYKEVQDRAREEVTRIMDGANGKAGPEEVQEFQYLERCIKESLRLFSPAAILLRHLREDLQLKHALIPAGTDVMIHTWRLHRDPNFWQEPDKFDPDRFLPENSRDRHPFCYIPFSAGYRNCIGQKFAMMELKSTLGYILYDFYLEPIDRTADLPLVLDILLRPPDPVHVKFIKINKLSA